VFGRVVFFFPSKAVTNMRSATNDERREPTEPKELLKDLIGEQVMYALGEPTDLLCVQVRPLWSNHFRVNVFTGEHAAAARIVNSYFLSVDADGNIAGVTPKIVKQYGALAKVDPAP
jgi:hypothetical protein